MKPQGIEIFRKCLNYKHAFRTHPKKEEEYHLVWPKHALFSHNHLHKCLTKAVRCRSNVFNFQKFCNLSGGGGGGTLGSGP